MNEQSSPSPSTGNRCWKWFRRGLLALAFLVTFIVLVGLEETWRGKRAMDKFRAECEAQGEHLDFASLYGPAIPDEQNFGASPVWAPLFKYERNPQTGITEWKGSAASSQPFLTAFKADIPEPRSPSVGSWRMGRRINLEQWQTYYRTPGKSGEYQFPVAPAPQAPGADVLLALGRFDTNLALLRESASRPLCRYPIRYEDGPNTLLPHLARLKSISQYLCLHSAAQLGVNQPGPAFDDVRLLMRTTDSLESQPLIITYLVRVAMTQFELQAIWEGIASHQWSDEQLATFQRELAKADFLRDMKQAMRGERACGIQTLEMLREGRLTAPVLLGDDEGALQPDRSPSKLYMIARPLLGGWFYQNELAIARAETEWLKQVKLTPAAVQTDPSKYVVGSGLYNRMANMLLPAFGRTSEKGAIAQNGNDLARVACALERYRLANSGYPDNLAALAPKYIDSVPKDIINDEPLKYHRTDDGRYILYSVGWNQKDDGGTAGVKKPRNTKQTEVELPFDPQSGDWVWSCP